MFPSSKIDHSIKDILANTLSSVQIFPMLYFILLMTDCLDKHFMAAMIGGVEIFRASCFKIAQELFSRFVLFSSSRIIVYVNKVSLLFHFWLGNGSLNNGLQT